MMLNLRGYTKTIWKTQDGRRIRVSKMEDTHVVSVIKFLRRRAERWMFKDAMRMGHYVETAPDMAAMAVEQEIDRLGRMTHDQYLCTVIPTYEALLKEAEKRKLAI